MRIVHKAALAGLGIAVALVASPASATSNTYVFGSNYNSTSTSTASYLSPDGGSVVFTTGVGTGTNIKKGDGTVISNSASTGSNAITATVTAWNATKSGTSYALTNAKLGLYQYGLGVTSDTTDQYTSVSGCSTAGSCNQHQIDNLGNTSGTASVDFVQIVFSKAVTLSAISQVAYAQPTAVSGKWVYDDDFSYGRGTTQSAYANSANPTTGALTAGGSLTQSQINTMFMANYGANGTCNSSTANDSYCYDTPKNLNASADQYSASQVWWIAASLLNPDSHSDAFKLYDFSVVYNDAPVTIASVPEPASWTMMIGGFGLIGGALRRKKAQERLAVA